MDAATELSTIFAYDAAGNLISRTDRASKVTGYTYDDLNRLSTVTDPALGVTSYAYDDRGNLLSLTDAKDQTTGFAYDKANRLVTETRPLGQATAYDYDTAGNLVEKLDAKNQKTTYIYDDAGRLTTIRYFNPVDPANPVKTVLFTYDKVGNLKTYDDGTTSGLYEYDVLNRKISEAVLVIAAIVPFRDRRKRATL